MNLLMLTLSNNLRIFRDYKGSNVEDKSKGRSRDWEEIENKSKKGPKKDKPNSNVVNNS